MGGGDISYRDFVAVSFLLFFASFIVSCDLLTGGDMQRECRPMVNIA